MAENITRMQLTEDAARRLQPAHRAAVEQLLDPAKPLPNVVGVGIGKKWKNGQPTDQAALVVLVSEKRAKDELADQEMVPTTLNGAPTDVLAVGQLFAGVNVTMPTRPMEQPSLMPTDGVGVAYRPDLVVAPPITVELLAKRVRPAQGGYSVGHVLVTAGTIATCVYDILPGGTISPPSNGVGIPPKFYILSNNHVLANSNAAAPGDLILQPGRFDGGTVPADVIARLSRFIPITFQPPIPIAQHQNKVDCAIAEGQFADLDREVYWSGRVRAWRPKARVTVGTPVKKTGRTTNFSTGRITAINATVDVGYGGGRVARFQDQIVLTNLSAPGDSGSLITTLDNVAVGLLFAGSSVATIANQIENVRSALRVEVAEEMG